MLLPIYTIVALLLASTHGQYMLQSLQTPLSLSNRRQTIYPSYNRYPSGYPMGQQFQYIGRNYPNQYLTNKAFPKKSFSTSNPYPSQPKQLRVSSNRQREKTPVLAAERQRWQNDVLNGKKAINGGETIKHIPDKFDDNDYASFQHEYRAFTQWMTQNKMKQNNLSKNIEQTTKQPENETPSEVIQQILSKKVFAFPKRRPHKLVRLSKNRRRNITTTLPPKAKVFQTTVRHENVENIKPLEIHHHLHPTHMINLAHGVTIHRPLMKPINTIYYNKAIREKAHQTLKTKSTIVNLQRSTSVPVESKNESTTETFVSMFRLNITVPKKSMSQETDIKNKTTEISVYSDFKNETSFDEETTNISNLLLSIKKGWREITSKINVSGSNGSNSKTANTSTPLSIEDLVTTEFVSSPSYIIQVDDEMKETLTHGTKANVTLISQHFIKLPTPKLIERSYNLASNSFKSSQKISPSLKMPDFLRFAIPMASVQKIPPSMKRHDDIVNGGYARAKFYSK